MSCIFEHSENSFLCRIFVLKIENNGKRDYKSVDMTKTLSANQLQGVLLQPFPVDY